MEKASFYSSQITVLQACWWSWKRDCRCFRCGKCVNKGPCYFSLGATFYYWTYSGGEYSFDLTSLYIFGKYIIAVIFVKLFYLWNGGYISLRPKYNGSILWDISSRGRNLKVWKNWFYALKNEKPTNLFCGCLHVTLKRGLNSREHHKIWLKCISHFYVNETFTHIVRLSLLVCIFKGLNCWLSRPKASSVSNLIGWTSVWPDVMLKCPPCCFAYDHSYKF